MTKPAEKAEQVVVSDAEKYLRDVRDGKVVACKRMKQLARMMLPRFESSVNVRFMGSPGWTVTVCSSVS